MTVQHKRLGRHGVLISNLYLGTMNFGWHTSEEDSFAIMDRALELGINFFDTADVYGWTVEHGLTEEIIGRWFAQGGGLLGGALQKRDTGRRHDEEFSKQVEAKRGQLEQYETLCRDIGHPSGEVALAWLLHNPAVTAPIIGPRNLEQLESAVRAAAIRLDEETLGRLDEIFPGPGGEAPAAYAW